jgi:hypothetical protein
LNRIRFRLPALAFILCFVIGLSATTMPVVACHRNHAFVVYPSGDTSGDTDWANIMDAFEDAKAAGLGKTVKLAKGIFYLNRPVQVADFDGTFKGAGMKKTLVRDAVDGVFGLAEAPLPIAPFFFEFYQSEMGYSHETATCVRISDMTTQVTGFTEWPIGLFGGHFAVTSRYADDGTPLGGFVNCEFNRVRLTGDTCVDGINFWSPNTAAAGYEFMPMSGAFSVRNSYIEYQRRGIFFLGEVDSSIKIGGWPGAGNEFRGVPSETWVGGAAVGVANCYDSRFTFSYCDTYDTGGLWVYQGLGALPVNAPPSLSKFVVMKNTLRTAPYSEYGGVEVYDFHYSADGIPTIEMKIIDNTFIGNGFMGFYAPIAIVNVNDGRIAYNTFIGNGNAAIMGGALSSSFSGWKIIFNKFHRFEEDVADIVLGSSSSDCIVFARWRTTVQDMGTDNRLLGRIVLIPPP